MKINRLYTLSQFIEANKYSQFAHITELAERLERITKYNTFLKQPLSKDMFVNETKDPGVFDESKDDDFGLVSAVHDQKLGKFRQYEKKVIFDDVKKRIDRSVTAIILPLNIGNMKIGNLFDDGQFYTLYPTLHSIAEITNGELKLKNLEL